MEEAKFRTPRNSSTSFDVMPNHYCVVTHIGPLQRTDRLNFEFLKIQDGAGHHLENHKNRDITATV